MKLFVAALLATLALTTGFTCSKNNPPEPTATQAAPPAQEQMGAPAEGTANPAATPAPADGSTTAPAAPAAPAPAEGTNTTTGH